jgi:hypothetical protein
VTTEFAKKKIKNSVILHGTLGSYLRNVLQEGGGAAVVACLPAPRAWASVPVLFSSLLVDSYTTFFVIKCMI